MTTPQRQYDVIIVGGGMVGASVACALGDTTLRIALLDAVCPEMKWPEEGFDIRVSAITRATQEFLSQLEVWPFIEAERVSPYREMHVWDATGKGVIHFDSAELGEPDLGHIIENRVIVKALHQRLDQLTNIDVLCPVHAERLEFDDEQVRLLLDDDTELRARLIVAADGGRSWVRQQAGINIHGWDYEQSALVTYVKTERHHNETAWQRFQPDGPLAFLPLTDGYSSIVWSTSHEHAKALLEMPEDEFALELAASFEDTLGAIEEVGPRGVFPLRFFETNAYVKPRVALVGDAAHMIHPLAGQGVNLGMADAQALVEVLKEAHTKHRDLGDYLVLRRYERWRKADNRSMLVAMDGFKRLFSSKSQLFSTLRNTGLNFTDHLPPLKQLFMRQALGKRVLDP